MTPITLTDRLEICFWQALVAVLKSRKIALLVACAIVLLACLPVSLLASGDFSYSGALRGMAASSDGSSGLGQLPCSGARCLQQQENVLVVLVDDLGSSEPTLEGVWLAARLISTHNVIWLPVFPTVSDSQQDQLLSRAMGLSPAGGLSRGFIDQLGRQKLWWNYYLIVDRQGITKLFELVGASSPVQFDLTGILDSAKFSYTLDDPAAVLIGQAMIARSLCQKSPYLARLDALNSVSVLSDHIRTDFDLEALAAELAAADKADLVALQGNGISCEFPTFQEASPIPLAE